MVEITQEFLKEHFEYRDGHLWWIKKTSKHSSTKLGQQFGNYVNNGYRQGEVFSKRYLEHRLIWFYHYGIWPKEFLDHINGIKDDNRIENLREATSQQNQFNKKSWGKTSQYKGVSWRKESNRWKAAYRFKGKKFDLGYYDTELEAAEAYRKATEHLHQEYQNYG